MSRDAENFPEISFVDTSVDPLLSSLVLAYEKFTNRTLMPGDPTRLFINWIADIIIQERVIINNTAKQNVPRFARGDFLDSLGELFRDKGRLGARAAKTTLRFTISMPLPSTHVIQQGIRVVVGEVFFATTESLSIPAGELTAEVEAICITTEPDPETGEEVTIGAKANGFVPGQISQIVDVFPHFHAVENITTSEGGAAQEEDDAYWLRMTESMESFSTAGPMGAYIYWARTASPLISDVRAVSPEPGIADIRVLLQGGELPGEEMLKKVYDILADGERDGVRPFTDLVYVKPPDPFYYDIDLEYWIPRPRANSENLIKRRIVAATEQYRTWQSERMGRDINPDKITFLFKEAGMKRAVITSPEFTVIKPTEVGICRNVNVFYRGLEDE